MGSRLMNGLSGIEWAVSPFQGWDVGGRHVPRALPWAELLRPLRGVTSSSLGVAPIGVCRRGLCPAILPFPTCVVLFRYGGHPGAPGTVGPVARGGDTGLIFAGPSGPAAADNDTHPPRMWQRSGAQAVSPPHRGHRLASRAVSSSHAGPLVPRKQGVDHGRGRGWLPGCPRQRQGHRAEGHAASAK